jgi:hypothetical protein
MMTSEVLYDEVRKLWVTATPEEIVRQNLLKKMIEKLSYPRELLSVEKSLGDLCSYKQEVPFRRVDIACFAKGKEGVYPLLLIECKESSALRDSALAQVRGYNHFFKATFIAVSHPGGETFGYPSEKGFSFLPYLPKYTDLIQAFTRR